MAKHFSAQASLCQMNVGGRKNLGLNWNRRDLYNYNNTDMDLSGRLTLLIYLHSKRLKQTLSPNMVILYRKIKKNT